MSKYVFKENRIEKILNENILQPNTNKQLRELINKK